MKKAKADADTLKPLTAVNADTAKAGESAPSSTAKKPVKDSIERKTLVQYGGGEWNVSDLEEKAITAYVAEGHHRGRIRTLTVYLKPEEKKIYYVINGKITGSTEFE